MIARTIHAHTVRIVDGGIGLYAQQEFLCLSVVLSDVMDIVGGHQGYVQFVCESDQFLVNLDQLWDVVVLQFQVEPLGAEKVSVPGCGPTGGFGIFLGQESRDLSTAAR